MRSPYSSQFDALESKLYKLEKQLSSISVENLNQRTDKETWSPLDVVQHLMLVEKASLAYVKKKSSYPDKLLAAGVFRFLQTWKLWLFMVLPIKIKAPKAVSGDNLREGVSLKQLISEWRTARRELQLFLNEYKTEFNDKLTYRHPFAGRLTLDNMLHFIDLHFKRHQEQIDRILKS